MDLLHRYLCCIDHPYPLEWLDYRMERCESCVTFQSKAEVFQHSSDRLWTQSQFKMRNGFYC
jgi:hypothetical protein